MKHAGFKYVSSKAVILQFISKIMQNNAHKIKKA